MTDSVIGDWLHSGHVAKRHTGVQRAPTQPRVSKRVRIWDLPTRLFHWSLVASIIGALTTPHLGDTAMPWHFRCGYTALTLVIFRLLWGIAGSRHARFSQFVKGPGAVLAYLKNGRTRRNDEPAVASAGHNPLGALSVLAMLGVVLLQAGSGLFTNDDVASEGPLVQLIDKALSDQISHMHADVTPLVIYALIGLHVAAIAAYRLLKRVDLVRPMLSGDKHDVPEEAGIREDATLWLRAAVCLAASASLVWCLVHL